MSQSSPSIAPRRRVNETRPEPFVMPQWAIAFIRPILGLFSRLFWRTRYSGMEHIPQEGGVIIAANHQTYLDPVWVALPIRREIRYLAWSESFGWPVIGRIIGWLGAWPLQVEKSDPTAIRRTIQMLKNNGAVVIFPEGGRCPADGTMSRFKNGAVRMALEANVPILPVTIRGGHRAWPKGYRLPRFARVEIIYHPLLQPTPQEGEDARLCARRETNHLAEIIASAL